MHPLHIVPVLWVFLAPCNGLILDLIFNPILDFFFPPDDNSESNLNVVYEWNFLKFNVPLAYSDLATSPRKAYITGISASDDRIFLATGRIFKDVPVTLSYVPRKSFERSPLLQPYPNWEWHKEVATGKKISNCSNAFVSVARTLKDTCNREWAIDSGVLGLEDANEVLCPPKIVIIDLDKDQVVRTITIPPEVLEPNSYLASVLMDRWVYGQYSSSCDDVFVYMLDAMAPAIIVYHMKSQRFWRYTNDYLKPDPKFGTHSVGGKENFTALLGPVAQTIIGEGKGRYIYFQVFASNKLLTVKTSVLQAGYNFARRKIPITVGYEKACTAFGLGSLRSNGTLIFSPICQGTLVKKRANESDTRVIARDPERLQVVVDIRKDSMDTDMMWLCSARKQDYFNGNVDIRRRNQWLMNVVVPN